MKDTSYGDAQHLAERVRDTMFATDKAAHALGMEVSAITPGHASVTMTVREDMLNGFGICQGGIIATLADMAFAYGRARRSCSTRRWTSSSPAPKPPC